MIKPECLRKAAVAFIVWSTLYGLPACHTARSSPTASVVATQQYIRTELFFGLAKPDHTSVTSEEWEAFTQLYITPVFPDGFTTMEATGQWKNKEGAIIREGSKIVVALYPASSKRSEQIELIRATYKKLFQQESILRTDTQVTVSF